ncbi:hypothetical protein BDR05DRAFT_1000992 [Suillus weaverae]|nr:hypothetical protein BDR05DRAFT_1000992 [Suillus weaverae]
MNTPTLNSLIFAKDTMVEMPLGSLYPSPAQTPAPMDNDEMTDLIVSSPPPTKPVSNSTNSLTIIPQFTPIPIGSFPHIHLAHAAQLFDYQAAKVIIAWLKVPHLKILVRVFDHDRKNPSIKDIAHFIHQDDQDVKVSSPCPDASKEEADFPLSFLVYNISDETKSLILDQHIWSSSEISFAAHLFKVNSPLLLFCLHGFSTMDTATVKTTVHEVWSEDVIRWDICNIMSESDIPEEHVHAAVWDFINSIWEEHLDFKLAPPIIPQYGQNSEHTSTLSLIPLNLREVVQQSTLCHAPSATQLLTPAGSAPSQMFHSGMSPSIVQTQDPT